MSHWSSGPPRGASLTRSRLPVRVLLIALLAALSLTIALVPAQAQAQDPTRDALEDLGIVVRAGWGDQHLVDRSTWTPVEVTIAPNRLVAGTLAVVTDTNRGQIVDSRDVEVSAGSTKRYRFVVPPAFNLIVQFDEGGDGEDAVRVRPESRTADGHLVGLIGAAIPAGAPGLTALGTGARGTWVAVDPAWLDRSPRVLESLATLVVPLSAVEALSDAGRRNLAAAVANGGQLVVVADTATAYDLRALGLPVAPATATTASTDAQVPTLRAASDAFTIPAASVVDTSITEPVAAGMPAGKGRIVVASAMPGQGVLGRSAALWGQLGAPNAGLRSSGDGGPVSRSIDVSSEVFSQAGDSNVPSLPWLGAFLFLYVLLIGPVNALVLGRIGRRELAWVTVPALTIVFAAGSYLGARTGATETGTSVTASWWIEGQGQQVALASVATANGGTLDLTFEGDDWDVTPLFSQGRPFVVDRDSGDTRVRGQTESFQALAVYGVQTLDTPPPLEVEAIAGPDGLTVEVTNRSGRALSDVRVRAATSTAAIGTLADGETGSARIGGLETLRTVDPYGFGWEFARDFNGFPRMPEGLEALLRWGPLDGSPGLVWATAGYVPANVDAVRALGNPTGTTGAMVAVGVRPEPVGDVAPHLMDRDISSVGFGELWRSGPLSVEGEAEVIMRFQAPRPVSAGATLISTLDQGHVNGRGEFFEEDVFFCTNVETRDADGNLIAAEEMCGDGFVPECPFDATSCVVGEGTFEFCFEDGTCQSGAIADRPPIAMPAPAPFGGFRVFEIYDVTTDAWVGVAEAFADGSAPAARHVTALGEILVRVSGQLYPFDYSGRGLAIVEDGSAA